MLLDETTWQQYSKTYTINYIFFDHRNDIADTEIFLQKRLNDADWKLVYLDDYSIIFVRTTAYGNLKPVTQENVFSEREVQDVMEAKNPVGLNYLGHLFYVLGWNTSAITAYNRSLEINPDGIRSRIGRGFVYAKMSDDKVKQSLALEDLNFAKKIGLKTPQYYLTIGQVYYNLGDFQNARAYWDKANNKDASYGPMVQSLEQLIPKGK